MARLLPERVLSAGMVAGVPDDAGSPAVGVIIVNYNGGAYVLDALASIFCQTYKARRVVVVDNASSDGSPAAIAEAYPEAEIVALDRNVGFAAANNLGIDALDDCQLVALLNPDAIAAPDWLESLVAAAHRHRGHASFASRVERADGSGLLDSAGDVYHVYGTAWSRRQGLPVAAAGESTEVFGPSGAAALYRRDWLLRVGAFDERFFCYFEDVDLALRLQVAGGRCLYVPEAHVRHVGGASAGKLSEFTIYHSQRNLVFTYVKSMPSRLFWRYLPLHVLLNLASIVTYAAQGHSKTVLRAKADAVVGLWGMRGSRRLVVRAPGLESSLLRGLMSRGPRVLLRAERR